MQVITEGNIKREEVNMGSIHFFAVRPEEKLAEGPWFEYRRNRVLTKEEQEKVEDLSGKLEAWTYAWMEELNKTGKWKRYYSDRFHRWLEDVYEANGEDIEPATELYLYPGTEGLYCTGIEETDDIFFGFMNLDDVECDFDVVHFLREYVRRLSIIIPDLLLLFDHYGEAYYRGIPITIKREGTKFPKRTAPRKDRIPGYVKDALGPVEILEPESCQFCKKADRKVTPQYIDRLFHAHESCFLEFFKRAFELKMV